MKKLIAIVFCCILAAPVYAQVGISSNDWQADLKFLQDTVHKDYPFLFKKITAEKFDTGVKELHQAIPDLKEHEIVTGLARIVSSFEYGHTTLALHGSRFKYHQLPLNLYYFNDGIYIEGVHQDYENILGAKLIEIAGVPVEKALAAIRPVVPAENDQFFKAHGLTYLGIPEVLHAQGVIKELGNTITLTVEREGQSFQHEITAVPARRFPVQYGISKSTDNWMSVRSEDATPLYLKDLDKNYFYEYLPAQKTVYIRHSQIQDAADEAIPEFYERVFDFVENHDVERLVLDVRLNGGGNNYKNKPIVTGIIESEKINKPGKLFVIIGRRTFSACQNLVNELDNYTNVIFVGEPTAENINFYGDNREVILPNSKIPVRLSFAWWQDKPQWENAPWTVPHLSVDMSFDEYRQNKDPVLEAALNFSSEGFVSDPIAYFTELFQAGKLDELAAEAERMVNDPMYRFFKFESEFNKVGYQLMGVNQLEEAMFVFKLNNKLFPESANAWDSLGEAYMTAGQLEKAVECYNKAIELDPSNVGANSRSMLAKIKAKMAQKEKQ